MTCNRQKHTQSGVTMLLAIFLLTGMVSIAALAGPLINAELTNSYATVAGEQMLFQARGQSEFSLFFLKRNRTDLASIPDCSASSSQSTQNSGVVLTNCVTQYYPNPTIVVVSPGSQRDFYFVNPSDPSDVSGSGVSRVIVSYLYGSPVISKFCNYDQVSCTVAGERVDENTTSRSYTIPNSGDMRRQLQVMNLSQTAYATVQLSVECLAANPSCGIPAGTNILNTEATFNGLTRRLRTIVP